MVDLCLLMQLLCSVWSVCLSVRTVSWSHGPLHLNNIPHCKLWCGANAMQVEWMRCEPPLSQSPPADVDTLLWNAHGEMRRSRAYGNAELNIWMACPCRKLVRCPISTYPSHAHWWVYCPWGPVSASKVICINRDLIAVLEKDNLSTMLRIRGGF